MDNEKRRFESVFSKKVKAGKRRTYFFDVRQTKGEDYYLTLTESTKRFNGDGYDRHKIFLYKEDFNRFQSGLEEALNYVKTELMPDYDYDEYTRRHEEWEAKMAAEKQAEAEAEAAAASAPAEESVADVEETVADAEETAADAADETAVDDTADADADDTSSEEETPIDTEDDMSW